MKPIFYPFELIYVIYSFFSNALWFLLEYYYCVWNTHRKCVFLINVFTISFVSYTNYTTRVCLVLLYDCVKEWSSILMAILITCVCIIRWAHRTWESILSPNDRLKNDLLNFAKELFFLFWKYVWYFIYLNIGNSVLLNILEIKLSNVKCIYTIFASILLWWNRFLMKFHFKLARSVVAKLNRLF